MESRLPAEILIIGFANVVTADLNEPAHGGNGVFVHDWTIFVRLGSAVSWSLVIG